MNNPLETEMVERDLHRAQLQYAEARQRALMNDGEAPTEDEAVLRKLEQDVKEARERVQHAHKRMGRPAPPPKKGSHAN